MIYGTDEGVFFSNLRDERLRTPAKVVAIPDVTQVDVLEEFQLLIVLAGTSSVVERRIRSDYLLHIKNAASQPSRSRLWIRLIQRLR